MINFAKNDEILTIIITVPFIFLNKKCEYNRFQLVGNNNEKQELYLYNISGNSYNIS